jgi:hypothetical protein
MSRPERFSHPSSRTSLVVHRRRSTTWPLHLAHLAADGERRANRDRSAPRPCYDREMVVRATPRSHPRSAFNGVKVFAATMFKDRERLGERVTQWRAEHPELEVVDLKVTQSSDAAFHCITISVFYLEKSASQRVAP